MKSLGLRCCFPILTLALAACGETVYVGGPQPPDAGTDTGAPRRSDASRSDARAVDGDSTTCEPPTPGAWGITAEGFSTACSEPGGFANCQPVWLAENLCAANAPVCPNAVISGSSYAQYSAELQPIGEACTKDCNLHVVMSCTPSYACNAGTCVMISGIVQHTCSPSDGPAVTLTFATDLACGAALPSAWDSIELDNIPTGPVTITFAPTQPDTPVTAVQSCVAGTCLPAQSATLFLTDYTAQGSGGYASGTYTMTLVDGTTHSGTFASAPFCTGIAMCG